MPAAKEVVNADSKATSTPEEEYDEYEDEEDYEIILDSSKASNAVNNTVNADLNK